MKSVLTITLLSLLLTNPTLAFEGADITAPGLNEALIRQETVAQESTDLVYTIVAKSSIRMSRDIKRIKGWDNEIYMNSEREVLFTNQVGRQAPFQLELNKWIFKRQCVGTKCTYSEGEPESDDVYVFRHRGYLKNEDSREIWSESLTKTQYTKLKLLIDTLPRAQADGGFNSLLSVPKPNGCKITIVVARSTLTVKSVSGNCAVP